MYLNIYSIHFRKKSKWAIFFLWFFSISVKVIQLKREANALKNKKKVVELMVLVLWSRQIKLIHSYSTANTWMSLEGPCFFHILLELLQNFQKTQNYTFQSQFSWSKKDFLLMSGSCHLDRFSVECMFWFISRHKNQIWK